LKNLENLKLRKNETAAIEEATQVLKERFPVKEVILFGSKARGDSDPESDIDLLLLTTEPIDWKERHQIVDALFEVEMEHDVVISIIVNTLDDMKVIISRYGCSRLKRSTSTSNSALALLSGWKAY
jgi:uncharacterized protein